MKLISLIYLIALAPASRERTVFGLSVQVSLVNKGNELSSGTVSVSDNKKAIQSNGKANQSVESQVAPSDSSSPQQAGSNGEAGNGSQQSMSDSGEIDDGQLEDPLVNINPNSETNDCSSLINQKIEISGNVLVQFSITQEQTNVANEFNDNPNLAIQFLQDTDQQLQDLDQLEKDVESTVCKDEVFAQNFLDQIEEDREDIEKDREVAFQVAISHSCCQCGCSKKAKVKCRPLTTKMECCHWDTKKADWEYRNTYKNVC